jgi:hypothetical protein
LNSSQWLPATVTAAVNGYVAFIQNTANGAMWSGVGAEVTVHRQQGRVTLANPLVDIVQSYTAQQQLASQRRRIGRK